MQSEPTIRAADPIDLAQLQHIERRSFPNLVSAGESALAYGDANILSKTNASDGTRLVTHLVATMDETVIGFAVARVFTLPGDGQLDPDRNVLLDRVAVLPDFRRGGVAAALVQQAVKQTSSCGVDRSVAVFRDRFVASVADDEDAGRSFDDVVGDGFESVDL